ncbi:MAG: protein-L-isoaspartate(D-aspartate) O-methyltransferase [Pirellulaceae bacterium]|nr:protein-L-isoaspartate(D-aspartate) O-methyltransferase [Pirellulaceae bacterium]
MVAFTGKGVIVTPIRYYLLLSWESGALVQFYSRFLLGCILLGISFFHLGLQQGGFSLFGQEERIKQRKQDKESDHYTQLREALVKKLLADGGMKSERVIEAIRQTERHEFVLPVDRQRAYFDLALPIGNKQTISSPFIVAYMTEAIDPQPTDKVLEIGTGSGYQAAVLSPLVDKVYTIEIVDQLARKATGTLNRLGYENIFVRSGDGYKGWAEHAPFDKIIVTCSPEKVPAPLVEQLKEGGLIVVPVGQTYQQTLYLMRKKEGKLVQELLRPTFFVPMTGKADESRTDKEKGGPITLVNGDFEEEPVKDKLLAGWFHQRQQTWMAHSVDSEKGGELFEGAGTHYVHLENNQLGRAAHLFQGLALDGKTVRRVELSAQVRFKNLRNGKETYEIPTIAVTFYDEDSKPIGTEILGPFRGTQKEWKEVKRNFRVPHKATDVMVLLGLFGATGELDVDRLRLTPVEKE